MENHKIGIKNKKVGFTISDEEYEVLLEKRVLAKKRGKIQLDRRIRAVILVGYEHISQQEAARMCETHPRNLGKWLALYRKGGYEELANSKYEGRHPRLDETQLAKLKEIVASEPAEYGYECGTWYATMVMDVIFKKFDVKFSASMVQKILRKLGFSFKLPKKNSPGQTLQSKKSGWIEPCRK
jgi:transposase